MKTPKSSITKSSITIIVQDNIGTSKKTLNLGTDYKASSADPYTGIIVVEDNARLLLPNYVGVFGDGELLLKAEDGAISVYSSTSQELIQSNEKLLQLRISVLAEGEKGINVKVYSALF